MLARNKHCRWLMLLVVYLSGSCVIDGYTITDYWSAMRSGQYWQAVEIMTNIIKSTDSKTGDMYYKRACAYEKVEQFVYAVIDCSTALEYAPNTTEYYALRGKCKQQCNDPTYLSDLQKSGTQVSQSVASQDLVNSSIKHQKVSVDANIPITSNKNPNLFVLILSAEEYVEPNISNADFANNDGLVFKDYCLKTLGIPEENIHFKKNVTLSQIQAEIRWLKAISKEFGDKASAIVYYSGHGYPDEITHQAYLLPSDGQIYDTNGGYSLSTLYSELGDLPLKYSIVLLDACFSGLKKSVAGGMLSSTRGIAIKPSKEAIHGNVIVLSATTSNNVAYPDPKNDHGLFTYHLLEKLQQTKGNVTFQELCDYVIKKVRESSTIKYTSTQIPCVEASKDLSIKLSDIKF